MFETRVDLSNLRHELAAMIGEFVRFKSARGELDKLEGPKYAARRAVLRREAGEAARARDVGTDRRRRRHRKRQRRAARQRKKRQEGERREWDDREVA